MQTLLENGVAFIIALQRAGDWMILPMRLFSYLGTEEFFFLVLPLIYWCIDAGLGLRVGLILVTSNMINFVGKQAFAGPRPYWYSSHVRGLWAETSFGVPSGHAQHAAVVWGTIAAFIKGARAWFVAIFLIFFIGFSRLYLGAHFPHDVVLGWLLGFLLLWAFTRYWQPVGERLGKMTFAQQALIAFAVSLLFIAVGSGVSAFRSDFQVPEQWVSNALLAGPEEPAPVDPSGTYTSAGTFFGLALGAAWIISIGGYQVSGPVWMRALRYVIGLVGVLFFWMGLGAILPRGDGALFFALRFVRYALVGWWVSGGAPWLFMKLKLNGRG